RFTPDFVARQVADRQWDKLRQREIGNCQRRVGQRWWSAIRRNGRATIWSYRLSTARRHRLRRAEVGNGRGCRRRGRRGNRTLLLGRVLFACLQYDYQKEDCEAPNERTDFQVSRTLPTDSLAKVRCLLSPL